MIVTVSERAFTKLNLFLNVIGRREDGFHDIVSIMHAVSLCDELVVTGELADSTEIVVTSSDPTLPTDESNLAYRSASKYLSHFNINAKIHIDILKKIPIGAGLGGGSSDAAATLRAMNKIFGLATKKQLLEIAAEIGSDVPFCLVGGYCFCSGRGEKINELETNSALHFAVAIGDERISTPDAYRKLDEKYDFFRNGEDKNLSRECVRLAAGLECREKIHHLFYNIFEYVTELPSVCEIKKILIKSGAKVSLMSGSGPAVFGLFKNKLVAKFAVKRLNRLGYTAFYASSAFIKD